MDSKMDWKPGKLLDEESCDQQHEVQTEVSH